MKIFSLITAFLATEPPRTHHRSTTITATGPLPAARLPESDDCYLLPTRRRLIERSVNNVPFEGLGTPDLHPGDSVKQRSQLVDPETGEEIGVCHTLATVLDRDVRLAHGAYNISRGERVGVVNFQALIPNHLAGESFDVAITSGTGDFHSANGYIIITPPSIVDGKQERDATFYICGLYR
jgi:hypothetical protein